MSVLAFPIVDLSTRFPQLFYTDVGVVYGKVPSNPEGNLIANGGSFVTDPSGNGYLKTTDNVATGWLAIGGGGSGTVTSVGLTAPSVLFVSPVSGSPVTTSGTLALALATQNANRVFAGPATGVPATPTFRALTAADLAGSAAPPANGIQYNDGTNGFLASTDFLFDPATGTLQLGVAGTRAGRAQWRGAVSGTVTLTVNQPSSNHVVTMPDALPAVNDLLRASSVSGNNVTWGWVAPSALGFPTINPTNNLIPYRSSASAFSDSPLTVSSGNVVDSGNMTAARLLSSGNGTEAAPYVAGSAGRGWYEGIGGIVFTDGTARLAMSSTGVLLSGTIPFGWNSSGSVQSNQTPDTGLARRAAGVTRITNGGSGVGQLLVGGSAATAIGQLHVNSSGAGVEAGYFEATGTPSVPTIRGVISSIQSFGLMASGKIVGGCNVPTANQQFSARGNFGIDVSELGNVGAGTTNLLSKSVIANSVANNGDKVNFKTLVLYANNVNNKQVEATFAGQSVFLISDLYQNSPGFIETDIYRTSSTTAKVVSRYQSSDVLLQSDCQYFELTGLNWATGQTYQVKGTATSNNDIINKYLESNITVAL